MGREPANLAKFLVGPVSQWEQTMIAALGETKYDHEPGTRFLYSNIGYAALGAALGRAAKMPFTTYVESHIFRPLGMTQTAFEPNAAIQPAIAKGYEIDRSGKVSSDDPQREHAGRGYKVPNGAIYTTVGDLARFVALELGEGPESVLKKEFLQEQQARVGSANGRLDSGYGVGFQLSRRGEHVFLGHSGRRRQVRSLGSDVQSADGTGERRKNHLVAELTHRQPLKGCATTPEARSAGLQPCPHLPVSSCGACTGLDSGEPR